MSMNPSPIEGTVTIHFVLTIDPTERCPLAAFAEFLTDQRLESTLFEAIVDTVGCNCLPVSRRQFRRNPEMTYNRPYERFFDATNFCNS